MGFTRTFARVAVVGGVVLGMAVVIAGPSRLMALFRQTRDKINEQIDSAITDPVALRSQLRDLEGQYPRKIAQVRADLAEVRSQLQQLQREQQVSARVVELADRDLVTLRALVGEGEAAVTNAAMTSGDTGPRRVELVFDGKPLTLEAAYGRVTDISNTRAAYSGRMGEIDRDMGHLLRQEERLASLFAKLEAERAEFQVQLWQLDRQVDSIARNDRMIEVLTRRQASIEEHSRYRAGSLEQITGRVSDIRARQEAELAALSAGEERADYELKAKQDLDRETSRKPVTPGTTGGGKSGEVIRIQAKPPQAAAGKP